MYPQVPNSSKNPSAKIPLHRYFCKYRNKKVRSPHQSQTYDAKNKQKQPNPQVVSESPLTEVQRISASLMRIGENQPTSHEHTSQEHVRLVSRMTLYAQLPTGFYLQYDAA